jgi:hypothetical protein
MTNETIVDAENRLIVLVIKRESLAYNVIRAFGIKFELFKLQKQKHYW